MSQSATHSPAGQRWSWRTFGGLAGAVLLSWGLIWLALQRPVTLALDVGGPLQVSASGLIEAPADDLPYLQGVYAPEPATLSISTTETYRWTRPQATVSAPALAGGPLLVTLRTLAPAAPATPLTITVNQRQITALLAPGPRVIHAFAPARADGAALIMLQAPVYQPPNDPRELGIALDQLTIQPLGWRLYVPVVLLGQLLLVLVILVAGAALSGLGPRRVIAVTLLAGATLSAWLLLARTTLTLFAADLLAISAGAGGMLLISHLGLLALARHSAIPAREWALVAGLTALGFGIRLAGMRHPQANFSDLLLHVNNFDSVASGALIFTEALTCEAGAGQAPYPPGVYVVLLPLLAIPGVSHTILLQAGVALLDSLTIPLLWWLVRDRVPCGERIGLWAALLYVAPSPILKSLTVGEMAQVGGQALAIPAIVALVVWVDRGMPGRWRGGLVALLLVAALAHSGTLISLGIWGVSWFGLLALKRPRPDTRWAAGQVAWLGALAVTLALVVYYSFFLGDLALSGNQPGCPTLSPLSTKLINLGWGLLRWRGPLPIWLLALGLIGARVARQRSPALALALWAWLIGALASQVSLIWSEQTVRWAHFLYPGLCIAAAIALETLGKRGRWGSVVAWGLVAAIVAAALMGWIVEIATYRTGNFI